MTSLKTKLLSSVTALLLCSSIYADDIVYSLEKQSLKEAIEKISKKSKIPYITQGNLLEGKSSNSIKAIKGTNKALEKILENSGLEAVIEDGAILIRKSIKNNNSTSNSLGEVEVVSSLSNITEGKNTYSVASMNTATKMNLSMKDTPQTISVITNQEIKDKNIHDFRSFADNVPGLHSPVWDTNQLYVQSRGFDVDYYQLDGIPTEYNAYYTEQNLIIYDRVEVVKGANGLSSGAGSPAASINMVRKHANSKEFTGELTLKAGSWENYSGTVDLTIPLTQNGDIRTRIIAQKEDKESFRDFYSKETDTFYGIVDADVSDQTKASLGFSYMKSESKGDNWGGLPVFFSDGSFTNFDASTNFVPKWAKNDKKSTSIFTNLEHVFSNDIKINANYSYNKSISNPKVTNYGRYPDKNTGLGLDMTWGVWNNQYTSKAHILDLYSTIPFNLGKQEHEIIIGGMYNYTKRPGHERYVKYKVPGQSIYSWNGNIAEPEYNAPSDTYDTTKQTALYAVGRFNLTDDLKLITGARLSNYYSDSTDWDGPDTYEHNNVLTPYAGLVYGIDENHSAFASYTSIFKPQKSRDINSKLLDPKDGDNYEIGLKGEYFDKRLNASLTYFQVHQDNVAEDTGKLIPQSGQTAYKAVKGVKSKGVELELRGDITDNWNINFGVSSFSLKDPEGNDVNTHIPRKEVLLYSKYKFDKFTLGGGVTWQDKLYANSTNPFGDSVKITQKDFYLVNAMAKYDFTKDLSLQLNVDNLFNKKYYSNVVYGAYVIGDPRRTTLTLNYKF